MGTLVGNFARAVWWGSLAGAAPFLLFTIPLGISAIDGSDPVSGLLVALSPLMITGTIVLGATFLIGLPMTAMLSQSGREHQRHYATVGLVAGALLPNLIMVVFLDGWDLTAALCFTLPGMIAVTVTGLVWGKWRQALSDKTASDLANDQATAAFN